MREIKFRAWVESRKAMVPVLAVNFERKTVDLPIETCGDDYWWSETTWMFSDVELMEFTGLTDKNGKEIYEGDIVTSAGTELIFQVVYKGSSFCRKWVDDVSKKYRYPVEPMAWNTHIICEVIGNIYENPELLKQ